MILAGKRVLITGAGHGLGLAIAVEFARAGAEIVVTDCDLARVDAALIDVRKLSAGSVGYPLDVTRPGQIAAIRDRLLADRGPIDVLINNAGVVFGGEFVDVPLDRHLATIAINLAGLLAATHIFLPDLMGRTEARIVNIASAAAVLALPLATSYAASKWGVLGFSDSLREELHLSGKRHVSVTTICPSYMATGLFDGARPARLTSMLTAETVARATRRAVERGRDFVMLPRSAGILNAATRFLPRACRQWICRMLGVSNSMADWRGYGNANAPRP
jgi:all-trans-retinol dehydrogenase (NAD+)